MLTKELISAHSVYLSNLEKEQSFSQETWRLVEALREALLPRFSDEIKSGETYAHYGRVCVETELEKAPYGQSIVFGIYQEPRDGVKFKRPHEPEFVVFWMMEPKNCEQLNAVPDLGASIDELKQVGFEFNFPRDELRNLWHVARWQQSMSEFVGYDLSELYEVFSERITALIESRFFKLARDTLPV